MCDEPPTTKSRDQSLKNAVGLFDSDQKTGGIYYPFGLAMAGISSKASEFGDAENEYK